MPPDLNTSMLSRLHDCNVPPYLQSFRASDPHSCSELPAIHTSSSTRRQRASRSSTSSEHLQRASIPPCQHACDSPLNPSLYFLQRASRAPCLRVCDVVQSSIPPRS